MRGRRERGAKGRGGAKVGGQRTSLALHWPSPAHARHSDGVAHRSTGGAWPAGSRSSSSSAAAAATAASEGPAARAIRVALCLRGEWGRQARVQCACAAGAVAPALESGVGSGAARKATRKASVIGSRTKTESRQHFFRWRLVSQLALRGGAPAAAGGLALPICHAFGWHEARWWRCDSVVAA